MLPAEVDAVIHKDRKFFLQVQGNLPTRSMCQQNGYPNNRFIAIPLQTKYIQDNIITVEIS